MTLTPARTPAAPGLLLVVLASAVSLALAPALAAVTGAAVSPLVVALAIGAVLGSARAVPQAAGPGLVLAKTRVLRAGIVLLGLQLSVGQLVGLGWRGALVITTTVLCTFVMTVRVGRALHVDARTRLYVATGFSICGAAAIAAMSGTVGQRTTGRLGNRLAEDDPADGGKGDGGQGGGGRGDGGQSDGGQGAGGRGDGGQTDHALAGGDLGGPGDPGDPGDAEAVGTALALVTLYGTIAVVALPWLVSALGLTDAQAGLLIGASVQEVGQVVAAAGAVSASALAAATVSKLARVVLLAPLTALAAARAHGEGRTLAAASRSGPVADEASGRRVRSRVWRTARDAPRAPGVALVPGFVLGFLGAVLVRSTGLLPEGVLAGAQAVQHAMLTAAMVALGTGVDVRRLVCSGGRPLALGAVSTVAAVGTAAVGVLLLG